MKARIDMFMIRFVWFALSLILLTPSFSIGNSLPDYIGSLRLKQTQSGEEAKLEIQRLLGKALKLREAHIGTYADGKEMAKILISEFDTELEATMEVGKMVRKLEFSGLRSFWQFKKISIEGMPVYFVKGMGLAHYFFQKELSVTWLTADPSLAKQAVRNLISKID